MFPCPIRLAALALLLTACGSGEQAGSLDLLVVTVDTLRADFLEPYGEEQPTSPALDAFAAQSVVFEAAQSTSSWTLPGLTSLHTSLEAAAHDCQTYDSRLGSGPGTLAEHLLENGFHTGAIASHTFLARHFGLSRGFADYDDELVQDLANSHAAVTSSTVTDKGIAWLTEKAKVGGSSRWFLWLHYFDPHARYVAHDGLADRFGDEEPEDLYRGEIAFTDRHVGRLLDALEQLDLARSTVVVVTADHGEEFLEHGRVGHGNSLHREVMRIPLFLRAPGIAPRRVASAVSIIDAAPTLLELLGVAPLPDAQGLSLVPLLRGEPSPPRAVVARVECRPNRAYEAIIDGRWKVIRDRVTNEELLFDRNGDSEETVDVSDEHPEELRRLAAELDRRLSVSASLRARLGGGSRVGIGGAEADALQRLGYAGDD